MDFLQFKFLGNTYATWIGALVVTFLAYFVLRFTRTFLIRRIEKVANQTVTQLDDLIVSLLKCTGKLAIVAISIFLGSLILSLPSQVIQILNRGVVLVILIQAASWGTTAIGFWIERYMKRRAAEDLAVATTVGLISFSAKLLLYGTLVLLGLSNFGINITALVAGLGVGGIAVALAAQNILSDLFASLTIVLDKPFIVGDFIIVGEFLGTIEHIGLKTTRLRSLSGEQLVFSNTDLLQSRVRNYKRMSERRVVFTIRVIHQTPHEKLSLIPKILRDIVESKELTRFDRAHFSAVGDFSFNFETVYWVLKPDFNIYMDIQQAINFEIVRRFRNEGIQFAYPTQNVHVRGNHPLVPSGLSATQMKMSGDYSTPS